MTNSASGDTLETHRTKHHSYILGAPCRSGIRISGKIIKIRINLIQSDFIFAHFCIEIHPKRFFSVFPDSGCTRNRRVYNTYKRNPRMLNSKEHTFSNQTHWQTGKNLGKKLQHIKRVSCETFTNFSHQALLARNLTTPNNVTAYRSTKPKSNRGGLFDKKDPQEHLPLERNSIKIRIIWSICIDFDQTNYKITLENFQKYVIPEIQAAYSPCFSANLISSVCIKLSGPARTRSHKNIPIPIECQVEVETTKLFSHSWSSHPGRRPLGNSGAEWYTGIQNFRSVPTSWFSGKKWKDCNNHHSNANTGPTYRCPSESGLHPSHAG